jgi:hypothetical protein
MIACSTGSKWLSWTSPITTFGCSGKQTEMLNSACVYMPTTAKLSHRRAALQPTNKMIYWPCLLDMSLINFSWYFVEAKLRYRKLRYVIRRAQSENHGRASLHYHNFPLISQYPTSLRLIYDHNSPFVSSINNEVGQAETWRSDNTP